MNNINYMILKYTGVNKFHKAGYFGERVNAAIGENWCLDYYHNDGHCLDPLNIGTGYNKHAINTAKTFFLVSPKAKLYMLYSTHGRYGRTYSSDFFKHSVDVIDKYHITNMYTSLLSVKHKSFYDDLCIWMNNHPQFKWCWSAGNSSPEDHNPILEISEMFGIGSYEITNNIIVPESYNSDYAEFLGPNGISIDRTVYYGTSYSAAWLCGMIVLIDDYFIDKCGEPLTREGMRQFIVDNSKNKIMILPDPEDIDIDKYWNIGRKHYYNQN